MTLDWTAIGETIVILLVSITWHELAHAFTAQYLGDDTPRRMGHLSLNPFRHMDQYGIILLFLSAVVTNGSGGFAYGFTPVNERNMRPNAKTGGGIVAVAGPLSNILLAVLIALPLRFFYLGANPQVFFFLVQAMYINIFLAIFNLIPLPPLDGWRVLATFLSPRTLYNWRNIVQYGPLVLFALIFFQQYIPVIPWLDNNLVVPLSQTLLG